MQQLLYHYSACVLAWAQTYIIPTQQAPSSHRVRSWRKCMNMPPLGHWLERHVNAFRCFSWFMRVAGRVHHTCRRGSILATVFMLLLATSTGVSAIGLSFGGHAGLLFQQNFGMVSSMHAAFPVVQPKVPAELLSMPQPPRLGPDAYLQRFSSGIQSFLPHGVNAKLNPSCYFVDPESKLVFDQVPGVSAELRQWLVDVV